MNTKAARTLAFLERVYGPASYDPRLVVLVVAATAAAEARR